MELKVIYGETQVQPNSKSQKLKGFVYTTVIFNGSKKQILLHIFFKYIFMVFIVQDILHKIESDT